MSFIITIIFLKVSVNLAGVTSMGSVILQVILVPIGQQL